MDKSIQKNPKVTTSERILSFVILFALFLLLDRLFDLIVPSWHRTFWRSAVSAAIFAGVMSFNPTLSRLSSLLTERFRS